MSAGASAEFSRRFMPGKRIETEVKETNGWEWKMATGRSKEYFLKIQNEIVRQNVSIQITSHQFLD